MYKIQVPPKRQWIPKPAATVAPYKEIKTMYEKIYADRKPPL